MASAPSSRTKKPSRTNEKRQSRPPQEARPGAVASASGAAQFPLADLEKAALLFFAVLIAYLPALRGGLLWDDDGHITKPFLRSLDGLWRIWFEPGATQQYYPLLHSAFWFEYRLWGDAVLGYHLTNIVLHAIAALLVVAVVRRLQLPGAWLAGFIFALHPVSVEAVAWISEQKSTLSAVFYLSAALVYLRFDRTRKRSDYLMALGLFLAALASKTVTATLPAALLVIFWWQRGRIGWKRDVRPLVPWFIVGIGAGIFTAWVERNYIGAQGPDFALGFPRRILLAGRIICFYFGKLIWPANLMFFYPHWTISAGVWWQYLFPAAALAVAAATLWFARRPGGSRGLPAALLLFAGTLFPALGFVNVYPFVYSYVADHFAYLASIAVIVPLACGPTLAAKRLRFDPRFPAAVVLAILAILTWRESAAYKDVETLYRTTLARNPSSWISHNNLGAALLNSKSRIPEAIAHFNAALALKPDSEEALNNLGSAYSKTGRLPEAIEKFEAALRIRARFPEAEDNLGAALAKTGRASEALAHLQTAIRLKPDFAEAHNNLGSALSSIPGREQDAIAEFRTALELDSGLTEAHNNLANALAGTPGHEEDAIAEYEAALRADPDSSEAHSNFGNALSQSGKQAEAIGSSRPRCASIRIRPRRTTA
jgi:protein O-mannosyl-transferase